MKPRKAVVLLIPLLLASCAKNTAEDLAASDDVTTRQQTTAISTEPTSTSAPLADTSAESRVASSESGARNADFTIAGSLLTPQGQPVRGESVYIFIFSDGQSFAQLGMVADRIVPVNPSGRTDDRGRFRIEVGSAFIRRHEGLTTRYTVGIYRNGQPVPIGMQGTQGVFDLELVAKAHRRVDLGSVTVFPD